MTRPLSLILATQEGVVRFPLGADGSLGPRSTLLESIPFEAVTQDADGTLLAGTSKGWIYRSTDAARRWEVVFRGFPDRHGLWSLSAHPVRPGECYAGLEPVALFASRDAGERWEELTSLRRHPASKNWHFYEPSKPHIRAIAFDSEGERIHIGIEVGGVLVSSDGGRTFEDRSQGVDHDVHSLLVTPGDPTGIFAMTGGGLYHTRTAGTQWERLQEGLDRWYVVPLAIAAGGPEHLCVGAANEPPPWKGRGADAALYWSADRGERWNLSKGPFPLNGMISSIVPDPRDGLRLYAGTTDGVLLLTRDAGRSWIAVSEKLPRIEEMLILQS